MKLTIKRAITTEYWNEILQVAQTLKSVYGEELEELLAPNTTIEYKTKTITYNEGEEFEEKETNRYMTFTNQEGKYIRQLNITTGGIR